MTSESKPPVEDLLIERFEVQRSAARAIVRQSVRTIAAQRVVDGHLPGSTHRNLSTECVVRSLVTHRVSFPAYILAYHYRGELYRVVVSGQERHCVTGVAPISWGKVATVAVAAITVVILILLLFAL